MENKVFLTGSSGFVGQNLLRYLNTENIYAISREELNGDLPVFTASSSIVHLAGKAHDLKKSTNPNEYYDTNFQLTKKLYNSFIESDARKFIFISSVKAAADSVSGILDENVKPDPKTDYGKSKLMAEDYIQSLPLPEGKSYYILRPCMIHGPGNKGNLNLLYRFVKKGIPYPLAAFENKRSFLSIENLCFIIKELLENNISSGIYNIADNNALSTNEVVSILAEASGKRPRLFHIPTKLIWWLAKIGDKIKLPLNSERLQKLTENYVVSNSKIINQLNRQLPLTSTKGLNITAMSFQEE